MPTKPFFIADLNVRGELQAKAEYRYEQLEQIPGAPLLISHFSMNLWRSHEEFEAPLPDAPHMTFRWKATASSTGISTLRRHGELASMGLLASGLDPEADHTTLETYQKHLLRELRNTEFEPAFALMELKERPLVVAITFLDPPERSDQLILALADRCFAAAFFRYHQLA